VSIYPEGWAPNTWRISGTSLESGWLAIPALDQPGEVQAWVAEHATAFREAWGEAWLPESEALVPLALQAALERRRPEDALAFQLWPSTLPIFAFVHVVMGRTGVDEPLPGPGDGLLFESSGLGQGVLVPRTIEEQGADLVGYDTVFAFDGVVVIVSVEPTFSDLLGVLSPSIHRFMDSLELVDPEGRAQQAHAPALWEADPVNTWVDSLTSS